MAANYGGGGMGYIRRKKDWIAIGGAEYSTGRCIGGEDCGAGRWS